MSSKKKHTNVELVMSVGGIRDLIWWLKDYQELRDACSLEDTIPSEETLSGYIGFLEDVLEGRDDQD